MNLKLKKLIDKELKKYPSDKKQSAVIAALAIMQNDRGWLSKEDISLSVRALRLLKDDIDIPQLMDAYIALRRKHGVKKEEDDE